METTTEKPTVELADRDGNAFAILGRCKKAMRRHYPREEYQEKWAEFEAEATSGDYDNLLRTVAQYFHIE